MKLEKISLHKLGPFEDLEITVQPCSDPKRADVHIFVGVNGTGKSTILRAIAACFCLDSNLLANSARAASAYAVVETASDGLVVYPRHTQPNQAVADRFASWSPALGVDHFATARTRSNGDLAVTREAHVKGQQRRDDAAVMAAVFPYLQLFPAQTRSHQGIIEIEGSPLAVGGGAPFMQWMLHQDAQEKYARAAGNLAAAERYSATKSKIETVLSGLFDRAITFQIETNPFVAVMHVDDEPLDSGTMPSGMLSLLGWLTDLFGRLNRVKWRNPGPGIEQPFILLLDEVDLHLHPAWQRKILAVVQDLFPNAQVFVSTHSPFVVSSVSDAWIYPLRLNGTQAELGTPIQSQVGSSYSTVLREVLGIDSEFSLEAEGLLQQFRSARTRRLAGDENAQVELNELAAKLSGWTETRSIVAQELRQIERVLKTAVA